MQVVCPRCRKTLLVHDLALPRTVVCPSCRTAIWLGDPLGGQPAVPLAPDELVPKQGADDRDVQTGPAHRLRPAPRAVPTHMAEAVLVTLFCCLPCGIVGICYASQVSTKLAAGDYDGAQEASRNANTWNGISLGIGLALSLLWMFANL